ncbi:MAG: hypothetical protein P4L40_01205 [Terracidiphilus sp.]|nr:hypothetical protein [Terracidiphilus sp.]
MSWCGIAVLWVALGAASSAQMSEWLVSQHGKQVGTARATVRQAGAGFATTAVVNVEMQGLKYALSKTEALTAQRELAHVELSAVVNGQAVRVVAQPEAGQLALTMAANGRSATTKLPLHAGAVLLPDFDGGAWETLLALAAAQNNRDVWAVLPKQAGSEEAVTLATYADEKGTLDGRAIVAHHLVATIAGAETQLFVGQGNELLQAELAQEGFALVRKGFVLTPPARAGAALHAANAR